MRLRLSENENVLERGFDDEPCLYFLDISAELLDGEDDEELVGRATACIFRHEEAAARGVPLFDVGDSIDQETHEVWCAVMDSRASDLRAKLGDHHSSRDILYIQTMQIVASHRGRGLGRFMLRRMMRRFGGGCAIVVIEPQPLDIGSLPFDEWRTRMQWHRFPDVKNVGARKLRQYWKKLGFKPLPGSKERYFFFDLETQDLPDDVEVEADGGAPI